MSGMNLIATEGIRAEAMMPKSDAAVPKKKISIYIDNQNLFKGGKQVSYSKLLSKIQGDRELLDDEEFRSPGIFGYGIPDCAITEGLRTYPCHTSHFKEKGADVKLAISAFSSLDVVDVLVLVTGDRDQAPTVAEAMKKGIYVEIWPWHKTCAREETYFDTVEFKGLPYEMRKMVSFHYLDDILHDIELIASEEQWLHLPLPPASPSPSEVWERASPPASPSTTISHSSDCSYAYITSKNVDHRSIFDDVSTPDKSKSKRLAASTGMPATSDPPKKDCDYKGFCHFGDRCHDFHPPVQCAFITNHYNQHGKAADSKTLSKFKLCSYNPCTNKECRNAHSSRQLICAWCNKKGHSPSFFEKTSRCPNEKEYTDINL